MFDGDERQRIGSRLRRADRQLATGGPPRLTAEGLQRIVDARRVRRRVRTGCVLTAAAAAVWTAWRSPGDFPPQDTVSLTAAVRTEWERADQVAQLHEEVARRLLQTARWETAQAELAVLERNLGGSLALPGVDREAAASLYYARRLQGDLQDGDAAAAEYRRIAERFAGTEWADFALQSLVELGAAL